MSSKKIDGTIVTLTSNDNYGCIIQRWALQQFLERKSYFFNSYYFGSYYWRTWFIGTIFSPLFWLKLIPRFLYRALLTKERPYWSFNPTPFRQMKFTDEFVKQRIRQEAFHAWSADKYDCYIVGSDQIWRDWANKSYNRDYYLLSFVNNPKAKRIAYAASFGKDTLKDANLEGDKLRHTRALAEKFDAIGAREDTAVRLVKEAWGLDAHQVIDPTLLLHAEDYSRLIDQPTCPTTEITPVFYYLLDLNAEKLAVIEQVAARRGQSYGGIRTYGTDILPPVEQWLRGFRDAKFVVTDSFHGTVFAIINHTPFITFTSDHRSISRITSLLSSLGLDERMLDETELSTFDYDKYSEIDWGSVEAKLESMRADSGNWLLKQLANG